MLAEMIDKLMGLAEEASAVAVVQGHGNPRVVLLQHGKQIVERQVPAPLRAHKIASFPDFVAAVKDPVICAKPEVYYGLQDAVAFCDRMDRMERVTLPIATSQRWKALNRLQEGVTATPKEAIQFLRYELSCASAEAVISGLRRIDFQRTSGGRNVNEHGRESLGRDVEAKVQQADQIPETFDLTICPATNQGFQQIEVTARVGVTIDFEQQRIVFRLLADELARARESFLDQLGSMIAEQLPGVPAFNGVA